MPHRIFSIPSIALVVLFAGCSKPPPKTTSSPQAVRVVKAKFGAIAQGRNHLAEVVSERSVRLVAQVRGTVSTLSVVEGEPVSERTPLVRVYAPDVAARVTRIHAERQRAEKERDFACQQLETDRTLAKSGDLTSAQLDRSEKSCSAATLSASAASAGEREASVARSRSLERAPFDGEVLVLLVDEGQTVMPGSPLLEYGSKKHRLRLRLTERELKGIPIGTRVESPQGWGQVVEIGAKAVGPGRLIDVFADLESAVNGRVGSTVTVKVVVDHSADACLVPLDAIANDENGSYVVVVNENGELQHVRVETGPRDEGWIAIEPPLPKDARVATGTVSRLDLTTPVFAVSL